MAYRIYGRMKQRKKIDVHTVLIQDPVTPVVLLGLVLTIGSPLGISIDRPAFRTVVFVEVP